MRPISCTLVVIAMAITSPTHAKQDVAGSEDHPLISRYKGSLIDGYEVRGHDRYLLALGPPTRDASGNRIAQKSRELEGKLTRILYSTPDSRSPFEIFRNYELALQQAGFNILYRCLPRQCTGYYQFVVYPPTRKFKNVNRRNSNFDLAKEVHYLAAKASTPEGDIYVSLLVAKDARANYHPSTLLEVIETREMDTGMVTVDADAIGKGIDTEGHMAIYGIYFDTGSAEVKTESAPTLEQISKLLKARSTLNLLVVGHTDSEGGYDHNMRLSLERAESVVKSLVTEYTVDPKRLKAAGVGYLSPVASNDLPEGRAKNRRVELVKH